MLTSNEPGVYHEGRYGIRIENLILAVPYTETEYGKFLKFETMTLFPIDMELIAPELLTEQEKNELNDYHELVREALSPYLNEEERDWLIEKTKKLRS